MIGSLKNHTDAKLKKSPFKEEENDDEYD